MQNAQGLPINFIVLAALAILILILAAGFVIGGGTSASSALNPQQAKNFCDNICLNMQRWASGQPPFSGVAPVSFIIWGPVSFAAPPPPEIGPPPPPEYEREITTRYCNDYTVTGIGSAKCDDPRIGSRCVLAFEDASNCQITCIGTGQAACE
jgi:hypothetical protein